MKVKTIMVFASILVLLGCYSVFAQTGKTGGMMGHGPMMGQGHGMMMNPMMQNNMGMMGDVMMKMQDKMSKGRMSKQDMQKMCGMMRDMAAMMHNMQSGCNVTVLQTQQEKMKTYENRSEEHTSELQSH